MKVINLLLVFLGGGLGSVLRYGISRLFLSTDMHWRLPLATLTSNVLASAILALMIYWWSVQNKAFSETWSVFWVIGFCGGFSTFSTFSYENWLLYRDGSFMLLAVNLLLSVLLCFGIFLWAGKLLSEAG